MRISANMFSRDLEVKNGHLKPEAKVNMEKKMDNSLVVEISQSNHIASKNRIENVFEAASLLKEVGSFITNNKEEALKAQGNLLENRVNDLLT